jgi:hypothetical protein
MKGASTHKPCKVVDVKQDKTGAITHIYVVKAKSIRYRNGRFGVSKWLKTKKRISVDFCTQPVRRIRREGNAKFQWEYPRYNSITTKAGVQWEGGQAPIAWWLNDQDLMAYTVGKRLDMNKKRQ